MKTSLQILVFHTSVEKSTGYEQHFLRLLESISDVWMPVDLYDCSIIFYSFMCCHQGNPVIFLLLLSIVFGHQFFLISNNVHTYFHKHFITSIFIHVAGSIALNAENYIRLWLTLDGEIWSKVIVSNLWDH